MPKQDLDIVFAMHGPEPGKTVRGFHQACQRASRVRPGHACRFIHRYGERPRLHDSRVSHVLRGERQKTATKIDAPPAWQRCQLSSWRHNSPAFLRWKSTLPGRPRNRIAAAPGSAARQPVRRARVDLLRLCLVAVRVQAAQILQLPVRAALGAGPPVPLCLVPLVSPAL